jgi:hypothetical protein
MRRAYLRSPPPQVRKEMRDAVGNEFLASTMLDQLCADIIIEGICVFRVCPRQRHQTSEEMFGSPP